MNLLKVIILLVVVVGVFGGIAFFGYEIFVKPEKLDQAEAAIIAVEPTPPPDYSLPAYNKVLEIVSAGEDEASRNALMGFISQYPQSTKATEAKETLGEINTRRVFSLTPGPSKLDYTVVSGDALLRIASQNNSNAELIMRANNLLSIDLQIGQKLQIPQIDMSIVVDRAANTITLIDGGMFFKEYKLLSANAPAFRAETPVEDKITDKLALQGSERVAFGGKNFVGSDRWLMLSTGATSIRGYRETDNDGNPVPMPPGFVVTQEDIEEIFPLVNRGTPVTVR